MNYIVATVLTNSADDKYGRVKVSSPSIWDGESAPIPTVGYCSLNKGDLVLIDCEMGIEYAVILGKYRGTVQDSNSQSGEGEIIWETMYGKKWAQLRSQGSKTIFKNSEGMELTIDGMKVYINGLITTPQSAGPPELKGPFCALKVCPFTGGPHVSTKTL